MANGGTAVGAAAITDWSGMVAFTPSRILRPTSIADLVRMLEQEAARQPPGGVRVVGGLHSCARIVEEDTILDLSGIPAEFGQVLGAPAQVVASGWMTARKFLEEAAEHGLSLTALGGTDAQTLGGLLATNTAGATAHHAIYDLVQWVEYLTIEGGKAVTHRVDAGTPAFGAMAASLGCIGVITRVGFNLVPERYFKAAFEIRDLSSVLNDLDATCAAHEFWRIEWLPNDQGKGLFWSAHQTSKKNPNGKYKKDEAQKLLMAVAQIIQETRHNGAFLNRELEITYSVLTVLYTKSTASGPMRNIIPCDRDTQMRVAMAEWSFCKADLHCVMAICRLYFNGNKWPNLPIEIECTKTDAYFMSPWKCADEPFIVKLNFQYLTDFLSKAEKVEIVDHLRGLWDALKAAGVPFKAHWGKINFLTPADTAKMYDVASFFPFMADMFTNAYLRTRL